jgi:UPF0148 protein
MTETDENRKLQKITRLLEMGGTMLANHHDCGAPLFRYQGKVLCPVCDFEEKKEVPEVRKPEIREPEEWKIRAEKAVEREGIRREVIPVRESQPAELSQISALTQSKILGIAISLEDETDLQRVKDKLECIELGLRVLKLLGS